jgi:hypothetical protein
VSPVKYEVGFYIPEDDILQTMLVGAFVPDEVSRSAGTRMTTSPLGIAAASP